MNYQRCSRVTSDHINNARDYLTSKLQDKKALSDYLTSLTVWNDRLKQEFAEDFGKELEPFYKELEAKVSELSYLEASEDEKKAILEPIQTGMREAEETWIKNKTGKLLRGYV